MAQVPAVVWQYKKMVKEGRLPDYSQYPLNDLLGKYYELKNYFSSNFSRLSLDVENKLIFAIGYLDYKIKKVKKAEADSAFEGLEVDRPGVV